jgi:LacI family transcriptional regulator
VSTIRQVAQEAGVSIGTVSRVLNNKPGVSEKTRQYVLNVAQELNYSLPKSWHLAISETTHLSLLARPFADGLLSNPFYADVFHGIEQVCRERHINLSFNTLDIVDNRLRSLPPLIKDKSLNGIVLLGAIPQEVVDAVVAFFQLPVILVDNYLPNCPFDAVMIDNAAGMNLAVEALVARGHRHIALIGGPAHPSILERCQGYQVALRQHQLSPIVINSLGLEAEDGEICLMELLQTAPETTAIICSNDMQAIGVLRKLQQLGCQVPDDFSLVGFDDINLTQFTSPPLTTIHVDRVALGRMAAQLLLERIENPGRSVIRTIIGIWLVERASVCAPRTHELSLQRA